MLLFKFSDLWTSSFWKDFWNNHLKDWLLGTFLKFIIALIVLLICMKIVDTVSVKIRKNMQQKHIDKTITNVVFNIVSKVIKLILFLTFLAYIGIETASITALIASTGVGIGLALQGALSNFAGGILIIVTRPFRVGDFIEAQGQAGTVENIRICYTEIVTPDNIVIMIPNGALADGVIVNKSLKDTRRVDVTLAISYDANILKAEAVIIDLCMQNDLILTDPKPFCRITGQADSWYDLTVRVWVKSENYWEAKFFILENAMDALEKNGIDVPYNKIDVNLINNK